MSLDMAKYAPALKEYYTNTAVENMVYKDHPALAMVKKMEMFFGESLPLPTIYGNPQGRSANFSKAKANKTSSVLAKFSLTRFKDYSLASIDNETAEASENDKGAFLRAMTVEIDGALQAATNSAASDMFGTGSGKIGQISALTANDGGSGNTKVELVSAEDIVYFEQGMSLTVSLTNGGGAGVKTANVAVVISVNRDQGHFHVSDAQATAITALANDYIFVDGDYDSKMPGFAAWIPKTDAEAVTTFLGVDRSKDPTRLGGIRFDGSAMPIEEALIKAASRVQREGGNPDVVFLSYDKYSDLEASLGSKVQYVQPTANGRADISFRGIKLNTNKGSMTVLADSYCPEGSAFMLTMKTWQLFSLKKMIRILDLDGNKVLRENDEDAVEVRVGGYKILGCNAPGWNAHISL